MCASAIVFHYFASHHTKSKLWLRNIKYVGTWKRRLQLVDEFGVLLQVLVIARLNFLFAYFFMRSWTKVLPGFEYMRMIIFLSSGWRGERHFRFW
nr:hypothetical protein CFP56_05854 [Quercus suber]